MDHTDSFELVLPQAVYNNVEVLQAKIRWLFFNHYRDRFVLATGEQPTSDLHRFWRWMAPHSARLERFADDGHLGDLCRWLDQAFGFDLATGKGISVHEHTLIHVRVTPRLGLMRVWFSVSSDC